MLRRGPEVVRSGCERGRRGGKGWERSYFERTAGVGVGDDGAEWHFIGSHGGLMMPKNINGA